MNRTLFLFRPEPGWSQTALAARDQGFEVAGEPLFTVEPMAWIVPPVQDYDALLVGSANVFRHGGAGLAALVGLPVYAVGQATADAAEAAGFAIAELGVGGLQTVLDSLGGANLRLLRLGGEVQVPLSPPDGTVITGLKVYRTVPVPLSDRTASALAKGGVVALHSGEAARYFASECQRLGVDRGKVAVVALAPRIAALSGTGWRSVDVASTPSDTHLLALAQSLCQSRE